MTDKSNPSYPCLDCCEDPELQFVGPITNDGPQTWEVVCNHCKTHGPKVFTLVEAMDSFKLKHAILACPVCTESDHQAFRIRGNGRAMIVECITCKYFDVVDYKDSKTLKAWH